MTDIPDEAPKKLCPQCNKEKFLLEFGTRIRAVDRLQTCCIECTKIKRKKYNDKNPFKKTMTEKQKRDSRYIWNGNKGINGF